MATKDHDLRTALTGLAVVVEGLGSLRTHKGSAHGRGKTVPKLKPRHARLAAHAAFTLDTCFIFKPLNPFVSYDNSGDIKKVFQKIAAPAHKSQKLMTYLEQRAKKIDPRSG